MISDRNRTNRISRAAARIAIASVALGATGTVAARAQGGGALDGLPFLFSAESGEPMIGTDPGGARGADVYRKRPGVFGPLDGAPPIARLGGAFGSLPLDAEALFPELAPGLYPDVDAISFGADFVPTTSTGVLIDLTTAPDLRWAAITFSVTEATIGAFGPISAEAAKLETASGDVFTYLLPGSGIAFDQWDEATLSVDSREIPLHATPIPAAPVELDAIDVFGVLFELDDFLPFLAPGVPGPLLPGAGAVPVLFFSVTSASAPVADAAWGLGATGASVLAKVAIEGAPGTWSWSAPFLAMTGPDLGIGDGEELDALAVDLGQGYLMFSTATAGRDPFLFRDLALVAAPIPPLVVRKPDDTPLSTVVGLDPIGFPSDDVDAICALDPRYQNGCSPSQRSYLLNRMVGVPEFVQASGLNPGSLKLYAEPGPSLHLPSARLILRHAPPAHVSFLLVAPWPSPVLPFLGAQVLFGAATSPGFLIPGFWASGSQVQQRSLGYSPGAACGTWALQTLGVKPDLSAAWGSEILLYDVGN